jgi:Zn-dependent peptidase ImmA (M78 family)
VTNLLPQARKLELDRYASDLVGALPSAMAVDLFSLVHASGVGIIEDGYGEHFEGMTVFDDDKFFIHFNTDFGRPDSRRGRFTLAHEIGHLYIPEHNLLLQDEPHPSKYSLEEDKLIELEANHFAGCLLMPLKQYKLACYRKPMSVGLIEELAGLFGTSQLATAIRFVEAGTFPSLVTCFKERRLSWFQRSSDFPYTGFSTRIGGPPPTGTALANSKRLGHNETTAIEEVDENTWFRFEREGVRLFEQCFGSSYGYEVSIVWVA